MTFVNSATSIKKGFQIKDLLYRIFGLYQWIFELLSHKLLPSMYNYFDYLHLLSNNGQFLEKAHSLPLCIEHETFKSTDN